MTQTDVAQAMGTTQSVVSHFERLGGDARFSTVQRYARAVGAHLHWQASIVSEPATTLLRGPAVSNADTCCQTAAAQ